MPVIYSGSNAPHCINPPRRSRHSYSIIACAAGPQPFLPYTIHLTYSGQTTVGHLLRYLGDDGIITYGTRTPKLISANATGSGMEGALDAATTQADSYGEVGIVTITSIRDDVMSTHGARAKEGMALSGIMGVVMGFFVVCVCC
jgi:hypothetical protein